MSIQTKSPQKVLVQFIHSKWYKLCNVLKLCFSIVLSNLLLNASMDVNRLWKSTYNFLEFSSIEVVYDVLWLAMLGEVVIKG